MTTFRDSILFRRMSDCGLPGNTFLMKKFGELSRQKFASIVAEENLDWF